MPVELLSIDQYADRHNISRRTIMRRLATPEGIPGAIKQGKQWSIPADAPMPGTGHGTVARTDRPAAAPVPSAPSLTAILDGSTAYLSIEDAARLMGLTEYAVRSNREFFEGQPFGPAGSIVIPQSTVRRIAGI